MYLEKLLRCVLNLSHRVTRPLHLRCTYTSVRTRQAAERGTNESPSPFRRAASLGNCFSEAAIPTIASFQFTHCDLAFLLLRTAAHSSPYTPRSTSSLIRTPMRNHTTWPDISYYLSTNIHVTYSPLSSTDEL